MLVLTRKSSEQILIGEDIVISVLKIMGNRVRIGIQASQDVAIQRMELVVEAEKSPPEPPPQPPRNRDDRAGRRIGHGNKGVPLPLHRGSRSLRAA